MPDGARYMRSCVVYVASGVSILEYIKKKDEELFVFFFQAEDGIRDVERSRGLGDVYKRQVSTQSTWDGQGIYTPSWGEGEALGWLYVLVYDFDATDDYFSIKVSFGNAWGEKGYARVSSNLFEYGIRCTLFENEN
eukprot:TRINITY_DN68293_c0_g1_i1.p2 TRINITY_DN68293_c0_g1~~TRINITY_DN68293_c0_g1_i1.p2  ORF type:complete len:136 (-),score=34.37 TRINITY_DN68293_c0_g1_i1:34-441(-)